MVNVQANFGDTALIMATRQGHVDCVRCLLQSRALVDIADKFFGTPIIYSHFSLHSFNSLLKFQFSFIYIYQLSWYC